MVTLQMRPRERPPELTPDEMRAFTERLSFWECVTVGEIVAGELRRRGFRRVRPGGRTYNTIEARVCYDLARHEVDLCEVGAQIAEAKAMAEFESGGEELYHAPPRVHRWRNTHMARTATKPKKKDDNVVNDNVVNDNVVRASDGTIYEVVDLDTLPKPVRTTAASTVAPTAGRSFFRDEAKPRPTSSGRSEENKVTLLSDEACNSFAKKLSERDRVTVAFLIKNELQRQGLPGTSRIGGYSHKKARKAVLSGLKHGGVDLGDVRNECEANGTKFKDISSDGVILDD